MAIGKQLVCSLKSVAAKKSVLLEQRNKKDTLLLEGGFATILGKENNIANNIIVRR